MTPKVPPAVSNARTPRHSIVTQLSLLFLTLAVINLVVTWVFSGANQMRLISEKANLTASSVAFEILRRLTPEMQRLFGQNRNSGNLVLLDAERIRKLLQTNRNDKTSLAPDFSVVTSEFEVSATTGSGQARTAGAEVSQNILKALQVRDLSGQSFMAVPNITRFNIELYIPLTNFGSRDYVFVTRLDLESIPADLKSLIRLLFATIAIMLIIQVVIGFLIYRILIKPIRDVSAAAVALGGGNFSVMALPKRQKDEIYSLIESFNQMTEELRLKNETIRNQMDELREKNDELDFELEIAERIQQSILPDADKLAAFGLAVEYVPLNRVSGDFYDLMRLEDNSVALIIADASGHGVPAAFLTILMKVFFSDLAPKYENAAELMSAINRQVSRYLDGSGFYLTAFYIRIYPDMRAEFCNCGHPPPLLLSRGGQIRELSQDNNVVGLSADFDEYVASTVCLERDDKLVLFTDGLTELKNPQKEFLPEESFREIVQSAAGRQNGEIAQAIIEFARKFQDGQKESDDLTLLVATAGEITGQTADLPMASKSFAARDAIVLRLLSQLIEIHDSPSYHALLINTHLKLGKHTEARKLLQRALRKHAQSISLSNLSKRLSTATA